LDSTSVPPYDCIVIGLGGFGSSALYHAAARGLSVLGLEQFGVAHDRGSSHGQTRIIRQAYFEHPDYVPLLQRAYELWRKLEAESGQSLLHLCGLLLVGPSEGEVIAGAKLAARLHGLPLHDISPADARERFPGFRFPESLGIVHEPHAGYLEVENCVRAHIEAAAQRGAQVSTDEVVQGWDTNGSTVRVRTAKGEYEAASLIVTAGAWASRILAELALPLRVVRKTQFWFPVRSDVYGDGARRGGTAFYFEMPFGHFYGFPSIDGKTVKAAEHSPDGETVIDPAKADRSLRPEDFGPLYRFLVQCLPELGPTPVRHSVCMYTLSPDLHFIVDRDPRHPNVAFGAGFSGHGFKFTSVVGEALVDLAVDGKTRHPIGFLSAGRDALKSR
jgi:sarcosine oxidase